MVIKDVKTELWNDIIRTCMAEGWVVAYQYNGFDKGIDHDLVLLQRNGDDMLFGWDNWFEGEIKCSDVMRHDLERRFQVVFKMGEPLNLKPEVVELELGKRDGK